MLQLPLVLVSLVSISPSHRGVSSSSGIRDVSNPHSLILTTFMTGHATWGFRREFLLEERRLEAPIRSYYLSVSPLASMVSGCNFSASATSFLAQGFVLLVCIVLESLVLA
jgi:hypothetical protein